MRYELYFTLLLVAVSGAVWFLLFNFLRVKRKKNAIYLLLFTIFYVYILAVLYYTLYKFQSLLVMKLFMPELMLNGQAAGQNINIIPIASLTLGDLQTSLLNILLFVPFGFGLPFIASFRAKKIIVAGVIFSVSIEFIQLITGILAKNTFRIADINDVIFNTLGAIIGYALFLCFVRLYNRLFTKQNGKEKSK